MSAQAVRLSSIDIDNALANAHLEITFQPIISFADQQVERYEAFVRWNHPGFGQLPPGAFIPFFETEGRISDLTRYVLTHAISNAASSDLGDETPISINLSISDVTDPRLPEVIEAVCAASDWRTDRVMLECPQLSPEMSAAEQSAAYTRLADTGCRLSLETRGRVTDAMREMDPFPFEEIKTGGTSVLRQVRSSRGGPGLNTLSDLLAFAKERGVTIVAVGVEDHAAAASLGALGFDAAQGNAMGRAGPLAGHSPRVSPAGAPGPDALNLAAVSRKSDDRLEQRRARIAASKRQALQRLQKTDDASEGGDADSALSTARRLQARLADSFDADRTDVASAKETTSPFDIPSTEETPSVVDEPFCALQQTLHTDTSSVAELAEDLMTDDAITPDDALDAVVEKLPVLPADGDEPADQISCDTAHEEHEIDEAVLAAARVSPAEDGPSGFEVMLRRRYRITHFWPRSWQRRVRRMRAAQAARSAHHLSADLESGPRREQDPVAVMA